MFYEVIHILVNMLVFHVFLYTFSIIPRTLGSTMLNLMIGHQEQT